MGDGVISVFVVFKNPTILFSPGPAVSVAEIRQFMAVLSQSTDPPDLFRKDAESDWNEHIDCCFRKVVVVGCLAAGWVTFGCQEKNPQWYQQSRSGSRNKVSWWLLFDFSVKDTHHQVLLNVVLLISISFNEHCRYIIENKSRNRRDVVSRVVKVPGIILCYVLLIFIFIMVTKKCLNSS